MSFESGSVSMRVFKVVNGIPLPENVVEKLAEDAIVGIEGIPKDGCTGWATGRHLLDRNLTEDTAVVAGRLRVTHVKAEKKIPSALFKAECRQEELAVMAATGAPFVKRSERSEIKKAIQDRMTPDMPPTLSGIDVVAKDGEIYASAMSDSQIDQLVFSWKQSTGQDIMPYTPGLAAMMLSNVDGRGLSPTSFSPEVSDIDVEQDIGTEFLTWLWYFSEAQGGMLSIEGTDFGFMLEGPFTLVHEGAGAHEVVLRKGNPGIAQEAKTALMAGKKIKKARLTVAANDNAWTCMIDGGEWSFGSLKLPKVAGLDPVSLFEDRMMSIASFVGALEDLFQRFLETRTDPNKWDVEVSNVRQWVADRVGKA